MQRHVNLTGFLTLVVIGSMTAVGIRIHSAYGSDEPTPTPAKPAQLNVGSTNSTVETFPSSRRSRSTALESGSRSQSGGRRATSLRQRMKSIRQSLSERDPKRFQAGRPTPVNKTAVDVSSSDPISGTSSNSQEEPSLTAIPEGSSDDVVSDKLEPTADHELVDGSNDLVVEHRPLKLKSTASETNTNVNALRIEEQGTDLIQEQGTDLIQEQGTDLIQEQGTDLIQEQGTDDPVLSAEVVQESGLQPLSRDSEPLSNSLPIQEPQKEEIIVSNNDPAVTTEPLLNKGLSEVTPVGSQAGDQTTPADEPIFTSQSPVLRVVTHGPRTVVVGKESAYILKVQNASDQPANGVVIDVKIPSGADVTQANATNGRARHEAVGEQEGRVRWNIEQVDPHSIEEITIHVVPRDNNPFELAVNWSFNPEASFAQIDVQEPKLEILLTGPSDILYGQSKVYTIIVRNPGTGDAENVVLNLLPINRNDAAGVRRLGTLQAGRSEQIDVELTAQQPGQIWIRAQAFGNNGLRAEVSEEVLVRRANLEVSLAAPEVKYAGTVAEYDVRVVNSGDAVAENVVATAVLPQGAAYVNGGGNNAQYDETSGRVTWTLDSLSPGAQRTVSLKCVLGTPGANRLEVVAEAADDLASFQSTVTMVEALADLKLTIEDPQGPVSIDDTAVYEVHLVNRGSKPAESIRVYAFFSEGIEATEVLGGEARIEPGQVVFEEIDQIGPGQEFLFKITAKASEVGDHIFRAEVTCQDPDTELAAQETTRFYGKIDRETVADESQGANEEAAVRR